MGKWDRIGTFDDCSIGYHLVGELAHVVRWTCEERYMRSVSYESRRKDCKHFAIGMHNAFALAMRHGWVDLR